MTSNILTTQWFFFYFPDDTTITFCRYNFQLYTRIQTVWWVPMVSYHWHACSSTNLRQHLSHRHKDIGVCILIQFNYTDLMHINHTYHDTEILRTIETDYHSQTSYLLQNFLVITMLDSVHLWGILLVFFKQLISIILKIIVIDFSFK